MKPNTPKRSAKRSIVPTKENAAQLKFDHSNKDPFASCGIAKEDVSQILKDIGLILNTKMQPSRKIEVAEKMLKTKRIKLRSFLVYYLDIAMKN